MSTALPPWGTVMELFRGKRSVRALQTRGVMSISHYKSIIRGKKGPTVSTLGEFLKYCDRSWYDWAIAFERETATSVGPSELAADSTHVYQIVKKREGGRVSNSEQSPAPKGGSEKKKAG